MNVPLHKKMKRKHAPSLAGSYLVEAKKREILEQLENAIKKLKEARIEIGKAVTVALKMKEAGDEIADQVVATVAQTFIINYDPVFA